MTGQIIGGILIPFIGTGLGAAAVFLLKGGLNPALTRGLNGCAAGIMAAASFFSLLAPSVETGGPWPAAAGFMAGMMFLRAVDHILSRIHCSPLNRMEKMMLAITLHNLPEGMAVGVVCAGMLYGRESAAAALALALGIALQNVPEGAIVSLPLHSDGTGKAKAFGWGVLSGAVEPLGAGLILLAAGLFLPLMPWLLSFAAGAMFCVILEELIPETMEGSRQGTLFFALGFTGMMLLDVLLG